MAHACSCPWLGLRGALPLVELLLVAFGAMTSEREGPCWGCTCPRWEDTGEAVQVMLSRGLSNAVAGAWGSLLLTVKYCAVFWFCWGYGNGEAMRGAIRLKYSAEPWKGIARARGSLPLTVWYCMLWFGRRWVGGAVGAKFPPSGVNDSSCGMYLGWYAWDIDVSATAGDRRA